MSKPLVLILCTGNACRSQMAEAFLRAVAGDSVAVASAGSHPAKAIHPLVEEVMAEKGFDLGGAGPKHMNEFLDREVAVVITLCPNAEQACPDFRGVVRRHHWPVRDPVMVVGTEEMKRKAFQRTREELEGMFQAYGSGLADGRMLQSPA